MIDDSHFLKGENNVTKNTNIFFRKNMFIKKDNIILQNMLATNMTYYE